MHYYVLHMYCNVKKNYNIEIFNDTVCRLANAC